MNAGLLFEASCVGGVPIIRTLTEGTQANRILSLVGIINGTTNYILTKMEQEGSDYETALKEAQHLGYAEFNPTADVEGFDAAYKLSILSSLAFSKRIPLENVYREGITKITSEDIAYGKKLGYKIKLLAIGKNTDAGIEVRVHPAFVPNGSMIASVNDSFNAVKLTGDSVGEVMLYGRGAARCPRGAPSSATSFSRASTPRSLTRPLKTQRKRTKIPNSSAISPPVISSASRWKISRACFPRSRACSRNMA